MSLILDALKKSDNERQRNSNPSIADVRVAAQPSAPPNWIWWLVGLLGINLMILMFVLLRPEDSPDPVTVSTVTPAAAAERQTGNVPLPMPAYKEEVRSLSREAGGALLPVSEAPASTPPAKPAAVPTATANAAKSTTRSERVTSTSDLSLPSYEDLRASGTIDLPSMHIDLHVYNAESSRRLVYINGKKYAEGDATTDGPRIEEIRTDGARLSYRGNDFLLPRD